MRMLSGTRPWLLACALIPVASAYAQAQSVDELLRRIDALQQRTEALQRRVDQLEGTQRPAPPTAATPAQAPAAAPRTAAAPPRPPRSSVQAARPAPEPPAPPPVAAPPPLTPEQQRAAMRAQVDEALRGDLPNSWRIPGTNTSVRLYGFAKANLFGDLDMVNRSDAPSVQSIPLSGSDATRRSGDLSFSARRSRIGVDTHTPSPWGPVVSKIEIDFAGDQPSASGAATSSGYMPRLRQAYVEIGGDIFRVLVGQASSVWNEGVVETLTDSTFLNASFVRQAQIRLTGRLMPGLTGMVSLEAPYTDYTSNAGVFYPDSNLDGGASPSFNSVPDLVGRLTWRGGAGDLSLRGVLRQLSIDTNGTAATPKGSASTVGYGFALNGNFNMSRLWSGFGADQLYGVAYYGEGIGRYFDSTTSGQSAFSTLGLPGVTNVSLSPARSYGATIGYRHYWLPQLRTNGAYGVARVEAPSFVALFTPGGPGAVATNRTMQMGVVNLIWSPFATERDGRINNGWLDIGLEYIYYRRNLQGGTQASVPFEGGFGIEQRIQAAFIGRF